MIDHLCQCSGTVETHNKEAMMVEHTHPGDQNEYVVTKFNLVEKAIKK